MPLEGVLTLIQNLASGQGETVVYEISFRNAGIGVMFYEPGSGVRHGLTTHHLGKDAWRNDLVVYGYHKTLREALVAEALRLAIQKDLPKAGDSIN